LYVAGATTIPVEKEVRSYVFQAADEEMYAGPWRV